MNTTLFLFTIGPVKAFIEHSRKARDLYAGSYLLSYLMKKVAEELPKREPRAEVIFPLPNQINVPNRMIARIDACSMKEREQLGSDLSQFVQEQWIMLCKRVFVQSRVTMNQAAIQQLESFLEVHWVFEQESDYSLAYNKVNASLNMMKRLRSFDQIVEPGGRKCDVFPDFNAIFVKRKKDGEFSRYIDFSNAVDITDAEMCRYAVKPGEGLSAIAFVKRMLHLLEEEQMLSGYNLNISSVAYMLLKDRTVEKVQGKLEQLKEEASEALFDLQNGQELSVDEYGAESIRIAKELYRLSDLPQISPYYALLKFDGDGMGQLYRDYPDRQIQTELSQATSAYSGQVRSIISEYGGICVYAGGEDFLGFLPLDKLFQALYKLREAFVNTVKAPPEHGQSLTFSAGIVIAHLMQPLGAMLARTGELERLAKDSHEEKNAYAIGLVKRSGDQLLVTSSFGESGDILLDIHALIRSLSQKEYSGSLLYNLSGTLEKLGTWPTYDQQPLVKVLIERALRRSTSVITIDEQKIQSERLYRLFVHFESDIERFNSLLQFAAFVSGEVQSCSTLLMQ